MSDKQILGSGEIKLMCCQGDSRANRSAQQASEKARMMTVTSGRKCCAALTKSGRLGLLVKTLLESPRWYNPRVSLTWKIKPLYSRRIIDYTSTDALGCLPLKKSVQILNRYNTKSSRSLFQLAVSEHRIRGIEFSSLLKTSTAWDHVEMKSWNTSRDRGTLGQQALMGTLNPLLLTPLSSDSKIVDCRKNVLLRTKHRISNLVEEIMKHTDGNDFHFNPLFAGEMMGFPSMWTVCPFLSKSGDDNL